MSALISGSETAFFSLSPSQLEELKTKYRRSYSLFKKADKLLATILISNNFVNVGVVIISTYLVESLFDFSLAPIVGFIIQVVIVTFIILLFGEIIPKLYANRSQMRIIPFVTPFLSILNYIFTPISSLLIHSTSIISKRIDKKQDSLSMDQLSRALELTDDEKINDEKDILEGIVRFTNIRAIDIIQPRINIIAIELEDNFEYVKSLIIEHGYSRMPIYNKNLDNITGVLYIKDLLPYLHQKDFQWQKLVRNVFFVPETKKINDLLEEFQSKKVHLAVVVDEYGGTSGIITMEDVLEEIIGEINDETDEQETNYIKLKQNTYIFNGHTLLNDFEKAMDLPIECFESIEGEADTLAGLILEIKGDMPKKNDVVTFHNHKFTVLEVNHRRIKKIKYEYIENKNNTSNEQ